MGARRLGPHGVAAQMGMSRRTTGSLLLTAVALLLALAFSVWCINISWSVDALRDQVAADVRVLMAIEDVRSEMFELDGIAMSGDRRADAMTRWEKHLAAAYGVLQELEGDDAFSQVARDEIEVIREKLDGVAETGTALVAARNDPAAAGPLREIFLTAHETAHKGFTSSVNAIRGETGAVSGELATKWSSLKILAMMSLASVAVLVLSLHRARIDAARHRVAEDGLRESEDRFRSVLAALPDLILVLDKAGNYRHIYTAEPSQLVGPRDELLGQNIHDRLDKDLAVSVQEVIDRAIDTGVMQSLEYAIALDGGERWFSASVVPYGSDHDPCVLWVARDTTHRRESEQRLRESEHRLSVMAENIDEVLVLASAEFDRFDYVSPAYETIWGRSLQSLHDEPRSWQESIHPDDVERVTAAFERGIGGGDYDEEYRIIRPDKSVRWIRGRTIPIHDPDGRVTRAAGVAQDITHRKLAEQALVEREERLRSVIAAASDAVIVADSSGTITLWNRASEEIFGYEADEAIGQPLTLIMPTRFRDAHQAGLRRAAEVDGNGGRALELTGLRKDGTEFPIELSMTSWCIDEGRFYTGIIRDITARVESEAALRESEQRFRSAFEDTAVGMALADSTGRFLRANSAFCRMLGYTEQELVGESFREFTHEDDIAESEQRVRRLVSGRSKSFTVEKRYRRKDGSVLWALTSVAPVLNEDGHPQYLVAETQDVTEQKRAEEALRESESRFRSIFENAGAGMATSAPDGRFTQVNAELCRFFGYEESELLQMTFLDVTHPDDHATTIAGFEEVRAGKRTIIDTLKRYVRKDGAPIWGHLTAVWVMDDDNRPLYAVAMIQDITGLKHAEDELRRSNERLEQRVRERTEVLTLEVSERKRAVKVEAGRSRVLERLSAGAPLPEVLTLLVLSLEEVYPDLMCTVAIVDDDGRHLRSGVGPSFDAEYLHAIDGLAIAVGQGTCGTAAATGERLVVEDAVSHEYCRPVSDLLKSMGIQGIWSEPILSSGGEILGVLGIYYRQPRVPADTDLDFIRSAANVAGIAIERHRAQERLRVADRLASIGTLAAGLGHDMNNVLFPIRCRFDALEWDSVPPELRDLLESSRESVEYLHSLSSGLRMIASDPDRSQSSVEVMSLPAWWTQVQPLIGKMVTKGVSLKATLDDDLPLIAAAPHVLTQAVLNLVVNASEAMPDGGEVTISTRPARRPGFVTMSVADTGVGMTDEVKRRALDPFFTTKQRSLSTGLGLSLVHGLVRRIGGTVEIDSTPGKGTVVRLTLPAAPATQRTAARNGDRDRATLTLDDQRTSAWVANVLETAGYAVAVARNGEPGECELWVTEPSECKLDTAERYLAEADDRRIIVLGPAPGPWTRLDSVIVVEDAANLDAIKLAVCEAATVQT